MRKGYQSEKNLLFSYFLLLILIGTIFLALPIAWGGDKRLGLIDAFFTATSAVCVTGLTTVNTGTYTLFGQIVILALIQAGGLGIISFGTIYLANPSRRISMVRSGAIRSYYLQSVEFEPTKIVEKIIILTLTIEAAGALVLYSSFRLELNRGALYYSIFHAVSAFCNAGFSLFRDSLEGFVENPTVNLTIITLIVLGGLGFVVLQDLGSKLKGRRKRLSLHSQIVLFMTLSLVTSATLLFFIFELRGALKGFSLSRKLMAALFQAVTPRTAGFNTLRTSGLSNPSKLLTILLMFIGGASGSIAGGIKTTTFFVILLAALRGREEGFIAFGRRINQEKISRATQFFFRALLVLFLSLFLLTITEKSLGDRGSLLPLFFECFSAFGTVGLSFGITPTLSALGKLVLIVTMFFGRVGLLALAIPAPSMYPTHILDYPEGEVLIG